MEGLQDCAGAKVRIYTPQGDLKFNRFRFPDGQPHFKLEALESYARDCVTIEVAIKSPADLFDVILASDVLDKQGFYEVRLDIRYLMGARMDRPISLDQPATLTRVSDLVNYNGFSRVRILDVHSEIALKEIDHTENLLPVDIIHKVMLACGRYVLPVIPDKGAVPRVQAILRAINYDGPAIHCLKVRDSQTGKLSGFEVRHPELVDKDVLIIDDICDGGGTFVGLAAELRKHGAQTVSLFVTHGIFSGTMPLVGIDNIYTTDSYFATNTDQFNWHAVNDKHVTVFPISMKEL